MLYSYVQDRFWWGLGISDPLGRVIHSPVEYVSRVIIKL
jgi:hypothetical protein